MMRSRIPPLFNVIGTAVAILVLLLALLRMATIDVNDEALVEEAKQHQRERITHLVNTDPTYKDFYSKPPKRSYPWD